MQKPLKGRNTRMCKISELGSASFHFFEPGMASVWAIWPQTRFCDSRSVPQIAGNTVWGTTLREIRGIWGSRRDPLLGRFGVKSGLNGNHSGLEKHSKRHRWTLKFCDFSFLTLAIRGNQNSWNWEELSGVDPKSVRPLFCRNELISYGMTNASHSWYR